MMLHPVGRVINGIHERPADGWGEVRSTIEIEEQYLPGLDGITEYSHVLVIFWLHRATGDDRCTLKVHPMGRRDLPRVGVFATRSPRRPNPVGATVCRLLSVSGASLTVSGLDALDGTPVVDIKGHGGSPGVEARIPRWLEELRGVSGEGSTVTDP